MSAINFVVSDVAGNISRGSVAGEGVPSSLIVGSGADVSLNLSSGQIISYTRQGQALEITLVDGRTIVIEGYFTMEGVSENQLFLSEGGGLTEVELTQGAGADYFASYVAQDGAGKFALNDDLYFMRDADVMLADAFVPADDEVGMLGAALGGLAPIFGWGGAAAAAGAAVVAGGLGGGGGGNGGPAAPVVTVDTGTEANDHVVNEADHADGVEITGTGTPGATVDVTIQGTTETTTVDDNGDWDVTFDAGDIEEGEYEAPVEVTITNEGGSTTVTDTLIVDTVIGVEMSTSGGDDGVINAAEFGNGVQLSGSVTGGDSVVVTIKGVDYDATVDGSTWTLDVASSVLGEGEYTETVTVTATDAAGNSSSSTGTVVVDTVTNVTLSTAGVGGSDNVINGVEHDGGVTLTGTAQPNATVVVHLDGVRHEATADGGGTWSSFYTSSEVTTGETTLNVTAVATDGAGNTASASGTVTIDTLVNNLELTSNGAGGADNVVNFSENGQNITMTGTVEPGSSVSVALDGFPRAASVDGNGNWSVTYPSNTLRGGEYETTVDVTATDMAGNTATASGSVTVDTLVNNLELTSNSAGGSDGVVNFNESGEAITMTGTVEAGSTVIVTLDGASRPASVDGNGNWSVTYPAGSLRAGEYETNVTVSATDMAGNTSSITEPVLVDTVAGELALSTQPIEFDDVVNFNEAADGVVISGTATAGLTVKVGFGEFTMDVVAQPNGTWSANYPKSMVPQDQDAASITASITDAAGNYREVSDTVKIDTVVDSYGFSTNPIEGDNVINAAEAQDGVVLSGTVEAGSTVVVNFGGQEVTVQAGSNGQWSANFPASAINDGEYFADMTATATDLAGNVSVITQNVQVDTLVNELTQTTSATANNVVNGGENADGVSIGGTVEAGSTVMVTLVYPGGQIVREASVDAAGNWTLDYASNEIPGGEYEAKVTIAATDQYGNTDSINGDFMVDTVAPVAPEVEFIGYTKGEVSRVEVDDDSGNAFTVSTIDNSGNVSEVAEKGDGFDGGLGEQFILNPVLENGSHLVINEMDAAGNEAATYVVLNETGTETVDLDGLSGFDVASIDLTFADDSALTLDLNTLVDLTNGDNNLVVNGGAGDTVTLVGGAQDSGQNATIGDKSYDIYTMGDDAQVFIDHDIDNVVI